MDKSFTKAEAIRKIQERYSFFNRKNNSLYYYIKIFIEACRKNQVEILEAILLLKGISIAEEMHRDNNFKILESAVMYGHLEVLNTLIELAYDPINFDKILHSKQDLIFVLAIKSTNLRLVNRLIELTPDRTKLNQMMHAQGDKPFVAACENGLLEIANRLVELIPDLVILNEMIQVDSYAPFRYAAENGHLNIVNRLIELTHASGRETMIHAVKDYAFFWAAANGHLNILNRLIELTPEFRPRDSMIHAECDYAFRNAVENCYLSIVSKLLALTPIPNKRRKMFNSLIDEDILAVASNLDLNMSQYLMSFKPELKPFILKYAENDEFKRRIKDSDKFVDNLITLRKEKSESAVMEVFEYLKYGKSIFNIVRASKSFITELRNLGILEVLIDYLGDKDVSLTKNEKVRVLNALSTRSPNLIDNRNPQDQKVSFVDKVLLERVVQQKMAVNASLGSCFI